MVKIVLILTTLLLFSAQASDLDSTSQDALDKTQALMKSHDDRQKYIEANPEAQAADAKIDALTGDQKTKDEIYDTSSDIFSGVVKGTGGDVKKQQELLNQAMNDPEGFFNNLTPAQQQQIRDIASKIQKSSPPSDSLH